MIITNADPNIRNVLKTISIKWGHLTMLVSTYLLQNSNIVYSLRVVWHESFK